MFVILINEIVIPTEKRKQCINYIKIVIQFFLIYAIQKLKQKKIEYLQNKRPNQEHFCLHRCVQTTSKIKNKAYSYQLYKKSCKLKS